MTQGLRFADLGKASDIVAAEIAAQQLDGAEFTRTAVAQVRSAPSGRRLFENQRDAERSSQLIQRLRLTWRRFSLQVLVRGQNAIQTDLYEPLKIPARRSISARVFISVTVTR